MTPGPAECAKRLNNPGAKRQPTPNSRGRQRHRKAAPSHPHVPSQRSRRGRHSMSCQVLSHLRGSSSHAASDAVDVGPVGRSLARSSHRRTWPGTSHPRHSGPARASSQFGAMPGHTSAQLGTPSSHEGVIKKEPDPDHTHRGVLPNIWRDRYRHEEL